MSGVTKDMVMRALEAAFTAGIGRLHAQFIDAVMNKDSDATRLFNRGLKRHLEVYEVAREAVEAAFGRDVLHVGPEAPTAMESAAFSTDTHLPGRVSPFKDYVPERKTP